MHDDGRRQAAAEFLGVQRAANLDLFGIDCEPRRQRELKAVTAPAEAGLLEIGAIAVREHLRDRAPVGINVETDRRVGMIDVLRPAGDAIFGDTLDEPRNLPVDAASGAIKPARSAMRQRTASTS